MPHWRVRTGLHSVPANCLKSCLCVENPMNELGLPALAPEDAYDFESVLLRCIPVYEWWLIQTTQDVHRRAIRTLSRYRKRDRPAVNLGVIVRVRPDVLGPRITWVRFKGKGRQGSTGKFVPTEPIRMQGKYRYSNRIFAGFSEDYQEQLSSIEDEFARLRYRTERLAALRDLCRQKTSRLW